MIKRFTLPAMLVAVLVSTGAANAVSSTGGRLPARVEVLAGVTSVVPPLPESLATAVSAANEYVATHADELAHAWVDRGTGTLVLQASSARGDALAATDLGGRVDRAVSRRITRVARSYAELERIKHAAIDLTQAGVPGADAILSTYVDAERNRVVVETNAAPAALVDALTDRFGGDAVVVEVFLGRTRISRQARNNDTSPYYGGANINVPGGGCTSGFPWKRNTAHHMITAGHCAPTGGTISSPTSPTATTMGTVTSGSGENFTSGTGTVYFTGQSVYRGDLARVNMATGQSAGTRVFVGGVNSTTSKPIASMWHRRGVAGDQYCTGGAYSGELCGWSVTQTVSDFTYDDGTVVRNVSVGTKATNCTVGGDSGGPVYTATTADVAAKGIHSGGGWDGLKCVQIYTDMWDVWDAFGGFVNMALTTLGDRRTSGGHIQQNHQLRSPNGQYTAIMQADGNFVLYKGTVAKWSTGTTNSANEGTNSEMQTDGNFVLYRPGRVAVWSSNTANNPGAYIRMQDDCNLVIYRSNGTAAWASNTAGC